MIFCVDRGLYALITKEVYWFFQGALTESLVYFKDVLLNASGEVDPAVAHLHIHKQNVVDWQQHCFEKAVFSKREAGREQ